MQVQPLWDRFIDQVLQGMNNVVAYVDDLIIFFVSFEEHKMHFAQLFQWLSQFNIVINPTKSQFGLKKLNFLGHLVTPDGILPLPERVEVVQKYIKPQTCEQLRAYLGFINYYHRFVPKLVYSLTSLYDLIKKPNKRKSETITWTAEAEVVFTRSKKLLTDATLLAYPVPDVQTSLHVDASDEAIEAVLQQLHDDIWKPIVFFQKAWCNSATVFHIWSRASHGMQSCYVNHFDYLVEGRTFTLWSDHKPLVAAFCSKSDQLISRRAWQLSFISEFTSDVRMFKMTKM